LEQRLLAAGAEQREQACEFIVVANHGGKDGNEDWLDDKNERADDERLREAVLMDVLQNRSSARNRPNSLGSQRKI